MAKPIHKNLTFQVLTAILIGLAIGFLRPRLGESLQVLSECFILLVKMVFGPRVFPPPVVGMTSCGGWWWGARRWAACAALVR